MPRTQQWVRDSFSMRIGGKVGFTGMRFIQSSPILYSTFFNVALYKNQSEPFEEFKQVVFAV